MSEDHQSVYDRAAEENLRAVRGPKLHIWDWVPGVLYNPKKIFLAVRVRGPKAGDFVLPLFLIVTFTMALAAVAYETGIADRIGQRQGSVTTSQSAAHNPEVRQESSISGLPGPNEALNPLGWAAAFTMGFLWMAIIASVVLFAIRLIGKQPLNFMGALALTGISSYAILMHILFSALLIGITGSWITGDPATWFGVSGQGGYVFLSYLNPFQLYTVALIGYGAHIVAKVEKQRAVIIVVVLWVLPMILKGLGQLMA